MELKKFQFKTELQEKYSATIKGIFFVDNQKSLLHLHHKITLFQNGGQ